MLKILFAILQYLPAFQKLLSEFFAEERAELQAQIDGYEQGARIHLASVEGWAQRAKNAQADADNLRSHISSLENAIRIKSAEIKRLQNETQQRLKAVAAMSTEDAFNASLDGSDVVVRMEPKSRVSVTVTPNS